MTAAERSKTHNIVTAPTRFAQDDPEPRSNSVHDSLIACSLLIWLMTLFSAVAPCTLLLRRPSQAEEQAEHVVTLFNYQMVSDVTDDDVFKKKTNQPTFHTPFPDRCSSS